VRRGDWLVRLGLWVSSGTRGLAGKSNENKHRKKFGNTRIEILGGSVIEGLFQPMHLIVIFAIALLVFGPKKLPELGKGLGDGIRGFKAAMNPGEEEKGESGSLASRHGVQASRDKGVGHSVPC
jgi:sec-independent protein translocase protein TatA